MKQRVSALDIQLLGLELKEFLEGYRLTNVYNIADSNRQFLLKFNRPESKFSVVVDCGLKIHITEYTRPIPSTPSSFVVKLRKHLKSKRLTALRQVANDRILVFQFADGLNYLVLEFFSAGNVILLDDQRRILSLQRIVQEHENKVGSTYEMFDESLFDEELKDAAYVVKERDVVEVEISNWLLMAENRYKLDLEALRNNDIVQKKNNIKKVKIQSIHKLLLSKLPFLSSDLLSKNLKIANINPSTAFLEFIGQEANLLSVIEMTGNEYESLLKKNDVSGYILAKRNPNYTEGSTNKNLEYLYETFHPFEPYLDKESIGTTKIIKIDGGYNRTLDKFFSDIESNKYALKIQNQEMLAQKKIDDARDVSQKKIQALLDLQASNEEKGHLIITRADIVDQAIAAVQGMVDQQMDWPSIEKLIEREQKKGNFIAKFIQLPLKLKENKIDLCLPLEMESTHYGSDDNSNADEMSDSDMEHDIDSEESSSNSTHSSSESELSDFETEEISEENFSASRKNSFPKHKKFTVTKNSDIDTLIVTVDLSLSAYANASTYFDIKKSSAEKQKKAEKNMQKAMKNIEINVQKQLNKKMKDAHTVLQKLRKPYFFEKYFWFISNEGYLVMMGKSPVETDQIYAKYIHENDIFVSNAYDSIAFIKNPRGEVVPPNTLMQAGIFSISVTQAWNKKISTSAYWCFARNVSKISDVDNSVLEPGMFRLKHGNQKNFMPPAQLVMGLGFLWKIKTSDNYQESDEGNEEQDEVNDQEVDYDEEETLSQLDQKSAVQNFRSNFSEIAEESTVKETSSESNADSPVQFEISEAITKLGSVGNKNIELSNREQQNEVDINQLYEKTTTSAALIPSINPKVRGKKGKLKKMHKKYADQDEDERLMRLEALGTLKGLEKQKQKELEDLERQERRENKKERNEKRKNALASKFTSKEKVKVNLDKPLSELKPSLRKEDEVVDVVPVFAPWSALIKYKYKVKIQPGNAKKTKTMSEILHYFMTRKLDESCEDKEVDWPQEHELVKALKEKDLVLSIGVNKVKASIPGLSNGSSSSKGHSGNKGSNQKSKKKK